MQNCSGHKCLCQDMKHKYKWWWRIGIFILILAFSVITFKFLPDNQKLLGVVTSLFPPFFYGSVIVLLVISCVKKFRRICYKIIAILLYGYVLLLIVTIHSSAKERSKLYNTRMFEHNIKLLGNAIHTYVQRNEGYLPVADKWCEMLMEDNNKLTKENFRHPTIEGRVLVFNKNLSNMRVEDVPNDVVLFFEAQGVWNLAGGMDLIRNANPNRRAVGVLLYNGDFELYWFSSIIEKGSCGYTVESLRWKP